MTIVVIRTGISKFLSDLMMKEIRYYKSAFMLPFLIILFISTYLSVQTTEAQQEDPNAAIFMNYFKQNWDDIHDVIMRFHNENPGLKGVVLINMNWQQGRLAEASVESNDTGDSAFGPALIEAMKKWQIAGLANNWSVTLPIRTAIYGSNDPAFNDCGIFTGNIADSLGKPLNGARVILIPPEGYNFKPDTVYSNREGIFILTLIQPGGYQVECSKKGYVPAKINKLSIEKGKHIKRSIIMKAVNSVTVPFILDHNRMLVEAEFQRTDGSWRKALLWVDTGNPKFLASGDFMRDLGLAVNDTAVAVEIPFPAGIRIGGMPIAFDSVQSYAYNGVKWMFNTMHNDGNLPITVLKNYDIVFDYPAKQLTIAKPGTLIPRGVRSTATINAANGIIQIDAVIDGENYSFAFDNGASCSFVPDDLVAKLVQNHPDWPNSKGAVGCANIWGWWPEEQNWPLVRVPEFQWGTIKIEDAVIAGLPPFFSGGRDLGTWYSQKTTRPVNGFLGPNVFKDYRVEIIFSDNAVYFEKEVDSDKNDMDIVGLTLKPLDDQRYEVIGIVEKDGKPVVTGIEPGDILLQIGDLKTTGATMGTVIDALRGKPGEKLMLILEREGRQFVIEATVQHIL
jgi:hypothetical protein